MVGKFFDQHSPKLYCCGVVACVVEKTPIGKTTRKAW